MDATNLEEKRKEKFTIGVSIMILLMAFTLGEFGIASVGRNLTLVLMLVALFKAFFIVRDYMHIGRLFTEEE